MVSKASQTWPTTHSHLPQFPFRPTHQLAYPPTYSLTYSLTIDLPRYFHALNLLLVINYSLYTYAFLYFETVSPCCIHMHMHMHIHIHIHMQMHIWTRMHKWFYTTRRHLPWRSYGREAVPPQGRP